MSRGWHHEWMPSLAHRLLDLALPARCPGCGREGDPICPACRPALDVRLDRAAGAPIGLPAQLPAPLVQLEWAAPFAGTVRAALHALKYSGERRLAEPLGEAAARRWWRAGAGGDLVVPVPVHAERARERGYDQAVLLAEVIGDRLGLPTAAVLERHRPTIAQFDLDRAHRGANVSGAFRLRSGRTSEASMQGRWVIVVDDVTTTGATLAACAEALMAAGALAVSGLTVARER
jgi:ComF family protein